MKNRGPSTPQDRGSFTPPPQCPPPPSFTPPRGSPLSEGEISDKEEEQGESLTPPQPQQKRSFQSDKPRHKDVKRTRTSPVRSRSPSVRSRTPPSRTPRTPRTPSPKSPRTPSPRRDRKRPRSKSPEQDNRGSSPKRKKEAEKEVKVLPHTSWTPQETPPHQAGVEELFEPAYGQKCVVVS